MLSDLKDLSVSKCVVDRPSKKKRKKERRKWKGKMTKNSKKPNLEIRDRKNFTAADVSFCDAMVGHV